MIKVVGMLYDETLVCEVGCERVHTLIDWCLFCLPKQIYAKLLR